MIGLRPEHIVTGELRISAPVQMDVVVDLVEPMGADTLVYATLNDKAFRMRMDGQARVSKGETLAIVTVHVNGVEVEQRHHESSVDPKIVAYVTGEAKSASVPIAGQEVFSFLIDGTATVVLTIKDPDLWWAAGQGDQPLYDLTVKVLDQVATRRIGLRDLELVTEKDDIGLGFKVRVNGRDIFCKGANWIPADALPGRITKKKIRDLLQSAVDANMNMVRIWGGGRYEPTSFYDTCDELGLLVWQDFMLRKVYVPFIMPDDRPNDATRFAQRSIQSIKEF